MEHKLLRNLLKILSGPWRWWERPLLLPSTSSTPSKRFRLLTQIRRRMRRSLFGFIVDIIWQQRWRATNNVRRMGTNWWDNVNEMALWHWCSCPVMQCYLVHNISPPFHCNEMIHKRVSERHRLDNPMECAQTQWKAVENLISLAET